MYFVSIAITVTSSTYAHTDLPKPNSHKIPLISAGVTRGLIYIWQVERQLWRPKCIYWMTLIGDHSPYPLSRSHLTLWWFNPWRRDWNQLLWGQLSNIGNQCYLKLSIDLSLSELGFFHSLLYEVEVAEYKSVQDGTCLRPSYQSIDDKRQTLSWYSRRNLQSNNYQCGCPCPGLFLAILAFFLKSQQWGFSCLLPVAVDIC